MWNLAYENEELEKIEIEKPSAKKFLKWEG
jgi:hypothetical protein